MGRIFALDHTPQFKHIDEAEKDERADKTDIKDGSGNDDDTAGADWDSFRSMAASFIVISFC